jgi:RimJ/RimL family protein N-acetyltransferase
MPYFQKIPGERIYLSPVDVNDAEIYARWFNDIAVSGNLGNYTKTISLSNEEKFLQKMAEGGQDFAIVRREGDKLLGNISLMDINHLSRRATLGLFIGEAENRGQGYGGEAIRLILDYGFRHLNLHNIDLSVHGDNAAAIRCYEKVGFRECGRRRESKFKNGRYIDVVNMDILDSEFTANQT